MLVLVLVKSVDFVIPVPLELGYREWAVVFLAYILVLPHEVHDLKVLWLGDPTFLFVEVVPDVVVDVIALFS